MIKSVTIRFFLKFSLFCLLIFGLIILFKKGEIPIFHEKITTIQAFLYLITLFAFFISSKGLNQRRDFHIYLMVSIGLRMFSCLAFVFIFINFSLNNPMLFVLNFFALYLLYTSFEIYFLLLNLRSDFKRDA